MNIQVNLPKLRLLNDEMEGSYQGRQLIKEFRFQANFKFLKYNILLRLTSPAEMLSTIEIIYYSFLCAEKTSWLVLFRSFKSFFLGR